MAYKQPDEETIQNTRAEHEIQKDILTSMELVAEYKQNNPVLNKQREVVRKLYDTILMYEAYKHYPLLKKDFCMFQASPDCVGELKNTFSHWFMYGNCCAVCNTHVGKTSSYVLIKDSPDTMYTIKEYLMSTDDEYDTDIDMSIFDEDFYL